MKGIETNRFGDVRIRTCERCALYQESQSGRRCKIGQDFEKCTITDLFFKDRANTFALGEEVAATTYSKETKRHTIVFFGRVVYIHPSRRWIGISNGKYMECYSIQDVWKPRGKICTII